MRDGTGLVGGLGTAYISGKFAVLTGTSSGVRLAVTPMIEILGHGAVAAVAPGDSRTQFGLPVSVSRWRCRSATRGSTMN